MTEVSLVSSAKRLADAIGSIDVSQSHYLSDFILVGLATDVCDLAFATNLLASTSIPTTGFATARSAFEGALEMRLLVAREETFDDFSAQLRVFELFEFAALNRRAPSAVNPISDVEVQERIEAVVREDARSWDEIAPGCGRLILQAWHSQTRFGSARPNHWTGLSRFGALRQYEPETPDREERLRELDYLWGQLSMEAHPRARAAARTQSAEAGRVTLGRSEAQAKLPSLAAAIACDEATNALAKRRAWGARGV